MIDFTKPVQTKDGNLVRILCTDHKDKDYPVVVSITWEKWRGGKSSIHDYTIQGKHYKGHNSPIDLMNVPEELKLFKAGDIAKAVCETCKKIVGILLGPLTFIIIAIGKGPAG